MKFVADASLGKLAKWLRILGYDTAYWRRDSDRGFLMKAEREGRIVLTRSRAMLKRQYAGTLVLIIADHVEKQLIEILEKLSLQPVPERFFSICLKCNEPLQEGMRKDIAGMVPAYVFETNTTFRTCPRCGGIFWSGTHRENILNFLYTTRVLRHFP